MGPLAIGQDDLAAVHSGLCGGAARIDSKSQPTICGVLADPERALRVVQCPLGHIPCPVLSDVAGIDPESHCDGTRVTHRHITAINQCITAIVVRALTQNARPIGNAPLDRTIMPMPGEVFGTVVQRPVTDEICHTCVD